MLLVILQATLKYLLQNTIILVLMKDDNKIEKCVQYVYTGFNGPSLRE